MTIVSRRKLLSLNKNDYRKAIGDIAFKKKHFL
jgi:hypothetical protein